VPPTILIVDDDPEVLVSLRKVLEEHDVVVESARDAITASALIDERRFCGMVLDLVLETGNGFDVLHHLKTKGTRIPTVVVSSKLPSYVREMLDADQVKLVFPKPVEPRLLAAIVLGLCGIASS
jgi:DNA-binding response OmpR family regulator